MLFIRIESILFSERTVAWLCHIGVVPIKVYFCVFFNVQSFWNKMQFIWPLYLLYFLRKYFLKVVRVRTFLNFFLSNILYNIGTIIWHQNKPKYTRGNLVFELEPLNGLSYCFEILHGYTLIFHVTVEIIFVVKIPVIRPVITCCHGNRGLNIWYKIQFKSYNII